MKIQGVVEDRLVLLKGVSGAFRPGVLTALMGVSGAGKTTLMDVLAGRKTGGYIDGEIKISGYPKKQETFARVSGYCEQNDIHSPQVTVYESLLYSAWLRLPPEVDSETRRVGALCLKYVLGIWESLCMLGFCELFFISFLFPFWLTCHLMKFNHLISIP
jgi:ABC-type multidrug transport system ATPase subunit